MTKVEYQYLEKIAKKYPKGDVIIAGTYNGADARTILRADPNRNIVIIDSFQGQAPPDEEDKGENVNFMKAGECNIGGIDRYLGFFEREGIDAPKEIYAIWITDEAIKTIEKRPVGIIFLDLDHYAPTKACLERFTPWLIKPGVVLVHDYDFFRCPGIKKCCDEFMDGWEKVEGTGFGIHFV